MIGAADQRALAALAGGGRARGGAGVDDLQGLLLQVSLAIMMIFMIAFFMFRMKTAREQEEQVMALTRQKLSLACDRAAAVYRERYGLHVLIPVSSDGRPEFAAGAVVRDGDLTSDPTIRNAFREGARSAAADYAYPGRLASAWRERALAFAEIGAEELGEEDSRWLDGLVARRSAELRKTVYNVQRSCAAQLQRAWLAAPGRIGDDELSALAAKLKGADGDERLRLAAEISSALKSRSLMRLAELAGAEMLP